MELQQMKYFKVVAELENMSQAAKELNIVQSAVSRSIKRLESELGTSLFERTGRSIQLNASGKVAYDRVVEVLDALERLTSDVAATVSDEVNLRITIEAASALMPKLLTAYKAKYPKVELVIDQQADRKNDPCDLRITSIEGEAIDQKGYLFTEKVMLLVPNKLLPINDGLTVGINQLVKLPFIGLKTPSPLRKITDKYLAELGLSPQYVFESDNPSMLRNIIDSGIGVVFFPEKSWGTYNHDLMTMTNITGHKLQRSVIIEKTGHGQYLDELYNYLLQELRLNENTDLAVDMKADELN